MPVSGRSSDHSTLCVCKGEGRLKLYMHGLKYGAPRWVVCPGRKGMPDGQ